MILYKKEHEDSKPEIDSKLIIDLKVSKNRNGQTGQCQIEFIPKTSRFNNTNAN